MQTSSVFSKMKASVQRHPLFPAEAKSTELREYISFCYLIFILKYSSGLS